jgi:hypothetical protein
MSAENDGTVAEGNSASREINVIAGDVSVHVHS